MIPAPIPNSLRSHAFTNPLPSQPAPYSMKSKLHLPAVLSLVCRLLTIIPLFLAPAIPASADTNETSANNQNPDPDGSEHCCGYFTMTINGQPDSPAPPATGFAASIDGSKQVIVTMKLTQAGINWVSADPDANSVKGTVLPEALCDSSIKKPSMDFELTFAKQQQELHFVFTDLQCLAL